MDCIRRLSGRPTNSQFAKSVSGTDSACISVDCEFSQLGSVCATLLEKFESLEYKTRFPYIDNLESLRKADPRCSELNQLLNDRLQSPDSGRLGLSIPDIVDEELLSEYKITASRRAWSVEHLTLDSILEIARLPEVEEPLSRIHLVGVDSFDHAVTPKRSLKDFLIAEIEWNGHLYIHCQGMWYAVDQNYVATVKDQLQQIEDISDELDLPPMDAQETEGSYNSRVAADREWLNLDAKTFRLPASQDKIEVCDLMTPDKKLICVKKMRRSSDLSHLFSQGSVSARLLRHMPEYQSFVNNKATSQWAEFERFDESNINRATVVYAIATPKAGRIVDSLFFFSQINLLHHVRETRDFCRVAICRITLDEPDRKPARVLRKGKTTSNRSRGSSQQVMTESLEYDER